eukprot:TRINITY_DN6483_c0_g1_i1.p1 TRINITY_DN6483_c0_g1~~TRINITY_DN6483_c0_g1_i1.p1  ORF type:complete len:3752 (+),score=775.80 TRINITY_DN6483_c0_g1_i1:1376-12631(+)
MTEAMVYMYTTYTVGRSVMIHYDLVPQVDGCSGVTTHTAASGRVSIQPYDYHTYCRHKIDVSGTVPVLLNLKRLNLGIGDSLQIYEGADDQGTPIQIYQGTYKYNDVLGFPGTVLAASDPVYIVLSSDESGNGRGSRLDYVTGDEARCPNMAQLGSARGTVTDGTGNYGNNWNCTWMVYQPGYTSVTVTFTEFLLGTGDSLDLYGERQMTTTSGTFLGISLPAPQTISADALIVSLATDGTTTNAGITLTYKFTASSSCPTTTGTVTTDAVGVFHTAHPWTSDCHWQVDVSSGSYSHMRFVRENSLIADAADVTTIYSDLTESTSVFTKSYTRMPFDEVFAGNKFTVKSAWNSNSLYSVEEYWVRYIAGYQTLGLSTTAAFTVSTVTVTMVPMYRLEPGYFIRVSFPSGFVVTGVSGLTDYTGLDVLGYADDGNSKLIEVNTMFPETHTLTLQFQVKTPPVSGSTGSYTIAIQDEDKIDIFTDDSVAAHTINAGTLTSMTSTLSNYYKSASSVTFTLSFKVHCPLVSGDKIWVDFPAGFTIPTGGSPVQNPTGMTIQSTIAVSSGMVVVTVTSSVTSGSTVSFELPGVTNPSTPGITGQFGVYTRRSDNAIRDSLTNHPGKRIVGDLGTASITPTPARVRTTGKAGVSFVTPTALSSGDKIEVTFPSGFTLTNGATIGSPSFTPSPTTMAVAGQVVTITIGAGGIASTATVTFDIPIITPPTIGTTGGYTIKTFKSGGDEVDRVVLSGTSISFGTIGGGATVTPSPLTASSTSAVTVGFDTVVDMGPGDFIEVVFPTGFVLPAAGTTYSVTGFTTGPASKSGQVMKIPVTTNYKAVGTTISIIITGVTNPGYTHTTADWTVRTMYGGSVMHSVKSDITGSTITANTLSSVSATPGGTGAYAATTWTFSFTTSSALVTGDKIYITFPAAYITLPTGKTPTPTASSITFTGTTTVDGGDKLVVVVNAGVSASTAVSFTIPDIRNPPVTGATGISAIRTTRAAGSSETRDVKSGGIGGYTVTAGTLGTVSITPSPLTSYASSTLSFSIVTNSPMSSSDKVEITFPASMGLPASGTQTPSNFGGGFSVGTAATVSGNVVTMVLNSGLSSGATATFDFAGVTLPPNSGTAGSITVTFKTSGGSVRDSKVVSSPFTVTAGALTTTLHSLSSYTAGATAGFTVGFDIKSPLIAGDKIVIIMPAGFTLPSAGTSVTPSNVVVGTTSNPGGQAVSLDVSGPVGTGTSIAILYPGFTNPSSAGPTGTFTVRTTTSGGTIRDQVTLSALNIVGVLTSTSITLASSVVRSPTTVTVSFVAVQAIPATGIIKTTFPSGFVLNNGETVGTPSFTVSGTGSVSGTILTVTVGGAGISASATVSFTYPVAETPPALGNTGQFGLQTRTGGNVLLDAAAVGAVTLVEGSLTASVSPADTSSYAQDSVTVSLTAGTNMANLDEIDVIFPADFTLPAGGTTYSVTGFTTAAASVSGQTMTIPVKSSVAQGASLSITITNVRNPGFTGATGVFKVRGVYQGSTIHSRNDAVTGYTITPGYLPIQSFTPTATTASASVTVVMVISAITSPLENGDTIEIEAVMTGEEHFVAPASQALSGETGFSAGSAATVSGNKLSFTVSGSVNAGTLLSWGIAGFTTPPVSGVPPPIIMRTYKGSTVLRDEGERTYYTNITPGALSSASVTPGSTAVTDSSAFTIAFTTLSNMVTGDQIKITFPAGFTLPASTAITPTGFTASGLATSSGQDLIVTLGAAISTPTAISFVTTGTIGHPSAVGSAGNYEIKTTNSTGQIRDEVSVTGTTWTGKLTLGATWFPNVLEHDIRTTSVTLTLTLAGTTWVNPWTGTEEANLRNAITGSASWDANVISTMSTSRDSATVVTVTIGPAAGYVFPGTETITVSPPASVLDSNPGAWTSPTFNVVVDVTLSLSTPTLTVTEGGGSVTYSAHLLTAPGNDVTVTPTAFAPWLSVVPANRVFTAGNYNNPQIFTVSAVDDQIAYSATSYVKNITHTVDSLDSSFNNLGEEDHVNGPIATTITDNDSAGLQVVVVGSLIEGGDAVTLMVCLTSQPLATVTATQTVGDAKQIDWSSGPSSLTFNAGNYDTFQNLTLNAVDDGIGEGPMDIPLTITAASAGADYSGVAWSQTVTLDDNDPVQISIGTVPELATGDGTITLTSWVTVSDPTPSSPVTSITFNALSPDTGFSTAPALTNFVVGPPASATLSFTVSDTASGPFQAEIYATFANGYDSKKLTVSMPVLAFHPPKITAFTPSTGSTQSSTLVTITGAKLDVAPVTIVVGGRACTGATFIGSTEVRCFTDYEGTSDGDTGDVKVTTAHGSVTAASKFGFYDPGTVISVEPLSTPSRVAVDITITGAKLAIDAADLASITVAGVECAATTFVSATDIRCTTGAAHGPRTGPVVVTSAKRGPSPSLGTFEFLGPKLTSVTPNSGPPEGGFEVTFTGTSFGTDAANKANASLAGVWCERVTRISDTQLTCVAARSSKNTTGDAFVETTTGGASVGVPFTYSSGAGKPVVSSFNPTSGPSTGGTLVTVRGAAFGASASDFIGVSIGRYRCAESIYVSSTEVHCRTSNTTTSDPVIVETVAGAGQSGTNFAAILKAREGFEALPPAVSTVTPNHAGTNGGANVTITGERFGNSASDIANVYLAGISCYTSVQWVSPQELRCVARPTASPISGEVSVRTLEGGTSFGGPEFTYKQPAPWIEGVYPRQGRRRGGTVITLVGDYYGEYPPSSFEIYLGRKPCVKSTWISKTTGTCETFAEPAEPLEDILWVYVNGTISNANKPGFAYFDDVDICDPSCGYRAECVNRQCSCQSGFVGAPLCEGSLLAVVAQDTTTSEDGKKSSLKVSLARRPSNPVTIVTSVADGTEATIPAADTPLIIAPGEWDREHTVSIIGLSDNLRDGNVPYIVTVQPAISADPSFNNLPLPSFEFTNLESKPKLLTLVPIVSPLNGTEVSLIGRDFDPPVSVYVNGERVVILRTGVTEDNFTMPSYAKVPRKTTIITGGGSNSRRLLSLDSMSASRPEFMWSSDSQMSQATRLLQDATPSKSPDAGLPVVVFKSPRIPVDGTYSVKVVNRDGTFTLDSELIRYTDDCPFTDYFGRGADCAPCPECGVCPGGYVLWAKPGCWGGTQKIDSGSTNPADLVFECDPPRSRCLGGESSECEIGYTGDFCDGCEEGYYPTAGQCILCPGDESQWVLIIVSAAMWMTYAVAGWFLEDRENFSHLLALMLALQSIGGVGQLVTSAMPGWVRSMYVIFELFAADINFLKPDCNGKVDYEANFGVKLAYNIGTGLPLFLGLFVVRWLAVRFSKKRGEYVQEMRWRHYTNRIIRVLMIHSTLIYLAVTTNALDAIACYRTGDAWRLVTDRGHTCFSLDHSLVSTASYLILVFFSLGFPIVMFMWQRRHDECLYENQQYMERYDYLYDPFIKDFRYYWIYEFISSFTLALGDTVLSRQPIAQFCVCCLPFVVHIGVIIWKRPYRRGWENPVMICVTLANIVGLLLIVLSSEALIDDITITILAYILVTLIGATSLVLLYVVFYYLVWTWVPRTEYDEEESEEDEYARYGVKVDPNGWDINDPEQMAIRSSFAHSGDSELPALKSGALPVDGESAGEGQGEGDDNDDGVLGMRNSVGEYLQGMWSFLPFGGSDNPDNEGVEAGDNPVLLESHGSSTSLPATGYNEDEGQLSSSPTDLNQIVTTIDQAPGLDEDATLGDARVLSTSTTGLLGGAGSDDGAGPTYYG